MSSTPTDPPRRTGDDEEAEPLHVDRTQEMSDAELGFLLDDASWEDDDPPPATL